MHVNVKYNRTVIAAQAAIHGCPETLDSRLRGNDGIS